MRTVNRDYFAEMYVAGILADDGWDVYFPRRDRGFDMIVSRPTLNGTLVRPIQVKGKYPTGDKGDQRAYGYVGELTALHDDMILSIAYFTSDRAPAPLHIAWLGRSEIKTGSRGFSCLPARYIDGRPEPRPTFADLFDERGLARFRG